MKWYEIIFCFCSFLGVCGFIGFIIVSEEVKELTKRVQTNEFELYWRTVKPTHSNIGSLFKSIDALKEYLQVNEVEVVSETKMIKRK
jgi:hypothetical protein